MLHCRWAHPTATCSWDSTVPSSLIPTNSLPSWYFPLHQHWHNNCLPSKPNKQKKKNVLWVLFSVFQPGKATESSKTGKRKTGPFYWLLDLSNGTKIPSVYGIMEKNPLPPSFEEYEKLTKSSNSFILALLPHHAFSSFLSCSRVCKGPRLLSQQTVLVDIRGGKSTFLTRPAFSSTQKV